MPIFKTAQLLFLLLGGKTVGNSKDFTVVVLYSCSSLLEEFGRNLQTGWLQSLVVT